MISRWMHPRSCKKAKASNICFEIQRICGSDRPWSNSRGEGEGERGRRGEGKKGKGREGERKGERRRGGGGKEIGERGIVLGILLLTVSSPGFVRIQLRDNTLVRIPEGILQ